MTITIPVQPLTAIDLEHSDHMDRAPYASLLTHFNAEIGNGTHELAVQRDDGLYRHLQVNDTTTDRRRYDVITWPGYLTVAGERGSHTFAAGPDDMLPLFDRQVNPGYWSEKLTSGRPDHVQSYSELHFRKWLLSDFWKRSRTLDHDTTITWWESLCRWLLSDWSLETSLIEDSVLHALKHVDAPAGHYDHIEAGMWDLYDFQYEYSLAVILAVVRTYRATKLYAGLNRDVTQKFDAQPYVAQAGKRLVTLEDFQSLPPGSVLVDVGWPDRIEPYGEVYQKYNTSYWNLPGDDMVSPPYSDQEFAGFAEKSDHLYYLIWQTKPKDSQ